MELKRIPSKNEVKVTVNDILIEMHKGFIEDVKPTWDKWEVKKWKA